MSFIYWYNSQPIEIFIELVILLASLLKEKYIYIYIKYLFLFMQKLFKIHLF